MANKVKSKKKSKKRRGYRFIYGWGLLSAQISIIALLFAVLKYWPNLTDWIQKTSYWWFFLAFLIFIIRPIKQLSEEHFFHERMGNLLTMKITSARGKKIIRRRKVGDKFEKVEFNLR